MNTPKKQSHGELESMILEGDIKKLVREAIANALQELMKENHPKSPQTPGQQPEASLPSLAAPLIIIVRLQTDPAPVIYFGRRLTETLCRQHNKTKYI